MKTKILAPVLGFLALSLSLFNASADPLNNWHWRNPLPNGNPGPGVQSLYGIVFTNGQFFAVGANGFEITSPDGTNWTEWATATTNQLNDIINANGLFVAVGANGTVETSTTGTNWLLRNSGTLASLSSVAFGNGGFVAVGNTIIASPDAVNWSPATSGPGGASQVAGISGGFVAVDESTNTYFSLRGLTWVTNILTAPGNSFFGAHIIASDIIFTKGSFLIPAYRYATSQSVDMFVFASSDGQHWTTNAIGNKSTGIYGIQFDFFMSGNGNAMAVGFCDLTPFILSSSNNVDWSFNSPAGPIMGGLSNAGAYGNGVYVFAQYTHVIYTSSDLVNWSLQQYNPPGPAGPTGTFNSITCSNGLYVVASSGSFAIATNESTFVLVTNSPSLASIITYSNTFVGVGSSGQIYQSTNGIVWTQHNSGTANNLNSVAGGNGLLVAVGNNGAVQTSPTGTIWTSRASGTSLVLYGVAYSNGLYVAVGQQGTVVTSPDAINWTVQDSGQLNNLLSVTYGSAGFLAVGASGTILTSPDGVNWTQQASGTTTALESVTFGNGYYLAAGANALVMTSPDGVNWASRNIGATGGQTLYGAAFLNGRFDVVGSGGTVLESGLVPPLFDLQMHAKPFQNVFSIFATPGSSYRILSSATVGGTTWSTAATINNAAAITLWTNNAAAGNQLFFRLISP